MDSWTNKSVFLSCKCKLYISYIKCLNMCGNYWPIQYSKKKGMDKLDYDIMEIVRIYRYTFFDTWSVCSLQQNFSATKTHWKKGGHSFAFAAPNALFLISWKHYDLFFKFNDSLFNWNPFERARYPILALLMRAFKCSWEIKRCVSFANKTENILAW